VKGRGPWRESRTTHCSETCTRQPCSFWLVDALYGSGQRREATDLFERLLLLRNDVGLLSEEWDPVALRQLGNTPQAFSHFGLVVSALQLHMGRTARSDNPIR